MLETFFAATGLGKGVTLGGLLGAIVSLKFIEDLRWWQGVCTVISGALIAAYCSPLAVEALNFATKDPLVIARIESACAFLIGVFGMSWSAAFVKAIPDLIEAGKKRIGGSS